MSDVTIIGGGLAGCEAALALAKIGVKVTLYEQKPKQFSPAHKSPFLAELVCSNSLKSGMPNSAGGLLKAEMRMLGSHILPVAEKCRVPAGGALAVDRHAFAESVTSLVKEHKNITLVCKTVDDIPREGIVIVASGPLTSGPLAGKIEEICGENSLSFYDAAAPIVTYGSIDKAKVFTASRYGKGEADYLNCPLNKEEYEAFYEALMGAERAHLNEFDAPLTVYEGCMPVELLARRGQDTLRYGPLRPVGLINPATGHRPWACVQLRREDASGSMYNLVGFQTNLTFPEQKRVFGMIPGLENAEFVRFGVMHRNTFVNSPKVLSEDLALRVMPNVFFAGQITGFEGYMESAACGILAARAVLARISGRSYTLPPAETMCGALSRYILAKNTNFQPMGANMGLLPALGEHVKGKRERYAALAERALAAMRQWVKNNA